MVNQDKLEQWKDLIRLQECSGLSPTTWCSQNKIKSNELNVYNYLKFLLEKMPNTDFNNHPELIESYLPWSPELPDDCRLIRKTRKQS